jgi:O-antigen/teichoic acid export membrane protein
LGARGAVAAGTLKILSARFAVAALAMVFIAVSTRILTLREMAVFAVYNSLCAVQAMICSLGLLTACARELPALMGRGDASGAARLLKTSLLVNASVSALSASVLAAAARPLCLLFLKDDAFVAEMRWVALAVFLWNLFEANQIVVVALQRFGAYGRANLACGLAQRLTSLALFAALQGTGRGLAGYIAGYGAGTLVGIAVQAAVLRDLLRLRTGRAPAGPLLRWSWPFYADGYFRYLYMQADQLLIGVFLTPEVLSLYFVAKRFVQYYQQIVASSVDPALAKVAEIRARGAEAVERSLRAASRYFTLVFLPFAAASASASPFLLHLAGGAPYREAWPALAVLSLSIAAYAAFNLVSGYIYVLGSPADRLRHNLVAGLSQIVLMAGLLAAAGAVPRAAMAGAVAVAAARIGALAIGAAFAHRQLARYVRPAYDIGALPRIGAASALFLAIVAIPQAFVDLPAAVPLYALAGAAGFLLAARPAVRDEDLDLVDAIFRGRAAGFRRTLRRALGRPAAAPGEG